MIRLTAVLACVAMLTLAPEANAATRTVKVITHNIAGAYKFHGQLTAVTAAVRQARRWRPDVVMLEEVCEAQARAFRDRLPGYHYVFTVMLPQDSRCPRHGSDFGHMVASKWPLSGVTRTNLRGDDDQPGEVVRSFWLTCALVAAPGVPAGRLRACVTHLRAGNGAMQPSLNAARTAQVHRIHRALHDDIVQRRVRVVVAGDFNTRPHRPVLDEMYRLRRGGGLGGAGDFFEGDQTDHRYFAPSGCGPRACRSGQPTCCAGLDEDPPVLDRKYDYVFFSAQGVSRLSGLPLGLGGSDHALYRARARFEF